MKKIFLVLTLFALSSTAAHSEVDESELMEASPDYVLSLFDSCNVYSEEAFGQ